MLSKTSESSVRSIDIKLESQIIPPAVIYRPNRLAHPRLPPVGDRGGAPCFSKLRSAGTENGEEHCESGPARRGPWSFSSSSS